MATRPLAGRAAAIRLHGLSASKPDRFRVLPASGATVLLPGRGRLPGGLWLHAACRTKGLVFWNTLGRLAGIHPGLIPARTTWWAVPLTTEEWEGWAAEVESVCGFRPHRFVVQLPRDVRRRRFSLLLLDHRERARAFAKFTLNPQSALADAALAEFTTSPAGGFWSPPLLASGTAGGWSYTLTGVMPTGPHRPALLDRNGRRRLIGEIQQRLLPAGIGDGTTTFPVHGDFGPWNVRQVGGRIAILDWEEMTVGPPAADELWHCLSWSLVRHGDVATAVAAVRNDLAGEELALAARFWTEKLAGEEPPEVDPEAAMPPNLATLAGRLREALAILTGTAT
jgi:hypothetical protein